jgi:hypothetical protein
LCELAGQVQRRADGPAHPERVHEQDAHRRAAALGASPRPSARSRRECGKRQRRRVGHAQDRHGELHPPAASARTPRPPGGRHAHGHGRARADGEVVVEREVGTHVPLDAGSPNPPLREDHHVGLVRHVVEMRPHAQPARAAHVEVQVPDLGVAGVTCQQREIELRSECVTGDARRRPALVAVLAAVAGHASGRARDERRGQPAFQPHGPLADPCALELRVHGGPTDVKAEAVIGRVGDELVGHLAVPYQGYVREGAVCGAGNAPLHPVGLAPDISVPDAAPVSHRVRGLEVDVDLEPFLRDRPSTLLAGLALAEEERETGGLPGVEALQIDLERDARAVGAAKSPHYWPGGAARDQLAPDPSAPVHTAG